MAKAIKYAEKAVVYAAKGAWVVFERLNRISPNPSFTPKWSDKPLLKSYEKEKPPLGWPPTWPRFSTTVTFTPDFASSIAAASPPGPAPTTTACRDFLIKVQCLKRAFINICVVPSPHSCKYK